MKKISVVIPGYNTEQYLKQCLDSVVKQTYDNLEIICVDDGSTDLSSDILDEFAREDSRIIVVHQENHGESYARNVGIRIATGDYVAFLDCDDWLERNMYADLMNYMEEYDVDIVASSWYKDTDNISLSIENRMYVPKEKLTQQQTMMYVYKRDDYQGFAYMWNKLYKKSAVVSKETGYPILFAEHLQLGGDVLYLAEVLLNINSAIYVDKAYYHYRQRNTSGCHTTDLCKRMDWLKAYEIVIKKFEDREVSEDVLRWVKRFLAYHSSNVAELAFQQDNKIVLGTCHEIMRRYWVEYQQTNNQYQERLNRYDQIMHYQL